MKTLRFDEINYWSEIKLEIIRKYADAYSKIINKSKSIHSYVYIDAFAGAGFSISKHTKELIPGSPLNALHVNPPFPEIHFIDMDGDKVASLNQIVKGRKEVFVYCGDCNTVLIEKVFPRCKYEDYRRGLCVLDPYGLNVRWEVIHLAGQMRSIEIFYNFMIMDANMNVFWRFPDKVQASQIARMDLVWGDRSWQQVAYAKKPGLFWEMEEKTDNEVIIGAFRDRIRNVAGFKYVPKPIPMRNSKGSVIYYLFFASQNKTGAKIAEEIFDLYRHRGAV